MPPHKSGLKSHQQKKSMPPHKQNEKGSGQKRERDEEYRYDEFDESDEEISDSSSSESTKKTPRRGSKTPTAKGPETPSLTTDKAMKYSESTPDSTPTKPASGKEGAVKCLSDFVEKEGIKYLGKLNRVVSSSENHNIEELVKSGATLSEHAEEIQKLGKRLLSMSEERFNHLKKRKMTHPS